MKKLCAETNRALNKVKDMFSPFSSSPEEKYVVKQLLSLDNNAVDLYSEDDKLAPGRLYIGDITSDGFPDLLVTLKYINGTTRSHVIINEPCQTGDAIDAFCTVKA